MVILTHFSVLVGMGLVFLTKIIFKTLNNRGSKIWRLKFWPTVKPV